MKKQEGWKLTREVARCAHFCSAGRSVFRDCTPGGTALTCVVGELASSGCNSSVQTEDGAWGKRCYQGRNSLPRGLRKKEEESDADDEYRRMHLRLKVLNSGRREDAVNTLQITTCSKSKCCLERY